MTVFLVSSSNPGILWRDWEDNTRNIEEVFRKTSRIESWKKVTDNVWLVEATADTPAKDVEDLLRIGSLWKEASAGYPVQNVVVALNRCDDFNFHSTGAQDVQEWLKARLAKEEPVPKTTASKASTPRV